MLLPICCQNEAMNKNKKIRFFLEYAWGFVYLALGRALYS